jgi:hypothetical protein
VRGQQGDLHEEAALELARLNVSRDSAYLQQAKKRAGGLMGGLQGGTWGLGAGLAQARC